MGLRSPGRARCFGGFTILELLISIFVIGVLLGILIVGFRSAALGARRSAEQASVRAMAFGVAAFEADLGFAPPLVHDGDDDTGGPMTVLRPVWDVGAIDYQESPVDTLFTLNDGTLRYAPAAYDERFADNALFLRGRDAAGTAYDPDGDADFDPDQRYSKFSLPYYLGGLLPSSVDGYDAGAGSDTAAMAEPLESGVFRGVTTEDLGGGLARGASSARLGFAPFFDADGDGAEIARSYQDAREYREHDPSLDPDDEPDALDPRFAPYFTAYTNREGVAFRYYRWEPERDIRGVLDYNIPRALLDAVLYERAIGGDGLPGGTDDDLAVDPTDRAPTDGRNEGDPRLKGARWAIVGPGPDGVFGTESLDDLAAGLRAAAVPGIPGGLTDGSIRAGEEERLARRWARRDNTVEVGR